MNRFKSIVFFVLIIFNSENSLSNTNDFSKEKNIKTEGVYWHDSFGNSNKDFEDIIKFIADFSNREELGIVNYSDPVSTAANPLSSYETYLPHATQRKIPKFESELLIKYLQNPANVTAAQMLAAYHLLHLYSYSHRDHANIERLKSLLYAQYFLLRSKQLGTKTKWVDRSIAKIELALKRMLPTSAALDLTEGNNAHKTYLEAFNYIEANRYIAEDVILKDLLEHPTNLLTGLYSCTVNLWNAGEADYDDPTALYSYIKASYLGARIIALSRRSEQEWVKDPDTHKLFRLSISATAFAAQPRRWLAKLHNDHDAVRLIDIELNQWLPKYPAFYAFPLAVMQFSEPQNAANGYAALQAAFTGCAQERDIFCVDHPRASYNILSFVLLASQYHIKMGDINTASTMLTFRYDPTLKYDAWNLGRDVQQHTEQNVTELAALYQNADSNDDPGNLFIKRRKWGPESSTCQLCHQAQGTSYTEEEKNTVNQLEEARLYVRDWPAITTTWYGSVIK